MTVSECAKQLGEAIAKDEAVVAFVRAKTAYETDEELQGNLREYQADRMALGQEHAKDTAMQDTELMEKLSARIDELYEAIVGSPLYRELNESQQRVNALMQSVNSDINFYAFGERPCTHDCSNCGADCASRG